MRKSSYLQNPPLILGLISVVLGTVGLLMFFMPILGIPLSEAALLLSLVGLAFAPLGTWPGIRWSIRGIALSALALAVGLAIAQAPSGSLPSRWIPLDTQRVPDRPYIPPPARPGSMESPA